jgi:dTDP-4-amino-4,6-dideoxygalactose transaminase
MGHTPGKLTRRQVLATAATAPLIRAADERLAVEGGTPVTKRLDHAWPIHDRSEEEALTAVLRSGHWGRTTGRRVGEFEGQYAKLTGTAHCVATANGTSALIAALNAIDIGPGDEVLIPPYTFVATLNVVLLQHALPVFVDTDLESFQMDPAKLEAASTAATRAVMPVHLGGSPADLDRILPLARAKGWKVVEDACQAHLGEWRGKKLGSLGDCGCFSFQASKNLNSGEGGALITNDEELYNRAWAFHGNGRGRKAQMAGFAYASNGANLRLTEFQAALLTAQMARIETQSKRREENAAYLSAMLKEIPGLAPARLYEGATRSAWHLYMFRYDSKAFENAPRSAFLKALNAEGVPASGGYSELNKEPFLERLLQSRHYQRIYGDKRIREWKERNLCPQNDRLCQEAVWFTQTQLLGPREEMDRIVEAIRKIRKNAGALKKLG